MIQGLSERLKNLRHINNLSQREVAKRLDVSPAIISSYETGERTPSTENLLALSYLYHCTTDYLLGRIGSQKEETVSVEGLTDKQAQLICELIDQIRN